MNVFFAIFGVVIGLWLHHPIVTPIQTKKYRELCIKDGLVPREEVVVSGNCVVCGKQLDRERLFVCKECESKFQLT